MKRVGSTVVVIRTVTARSWRQLRSDYVVAGSRPPAGYGAHSVDSRTLVVIVSTADPGIPEAAPAPDGW